MNSNDQQAEFPIIINLKENTIDEENTDEEEKHTSNTEQGQYNYIEEAFDIPQTANDDYLTFDLAQQDDEAFHLANRTFYTTCHKISRQNSPSYRKNPPYSFLENWLIHCVFSKSQQILLRFPIIQPKVMITEGDFIYTPHQMATHEPQQSMNYDYDEEDYDYDDTFIIGDEGVLVMAASAPDASEFMTLDDEDDDKRMQSYVIDENMWMSHGRYNSTGLTLHVVNPDEDEQKDVQNQSILNHSTETMPIAHRTSNSFQNQLQVVKEEDEETEEIFDIQKQEASQRQIMSADIIQRYRSTEMQYIAANTPKLIYSNTATTSLDNSTLLTMNDEQLNPNDNNSDCSSDHSNLSSDSSSCSYSKPLQNTTTYYFDDEKSTMTSHHSASSSYQSLADIIDRRVQNNLGSSYGTLPNSQQNAIEDQLSPLMQISFCLVDTTWMALNLAHSYSEDEAKSAMGFISCMFKIWKILFLGVEMMLGWGKNKRYEVV
ncbi:uncharacterized protein BX663DRAFT_510623 [Cokeromyces recurvatus]|uniref:uncharacterized protein n=1 Tax=Cokeromyces recurvatus TaxID=90255 RepID=UPI00221EA1A7|nr:uncharacterized protein BX663DRAFT_510623 [Cokeromyces recurvatus]KAI7902283.1 hypothetical protein BX663DRAFT_510623 [Cokeromyces recurvatus]